MGWRDHLLQLFARGIRDVRGEALDVDVVIRVLDRIAADAEISDRLDALDQDSVRSEFLALYESETSGDR